MTTLAELGIERIEVIDLGPNDILLVTVPNGLSAEQLGDIKERFISLAKEWGIAPKILIKPRDIEVEVVQPEQQ